MYRIFEEFVLNISYYYLDVVTSADRKVLRESMLWNIYIGNRPPISQASCFWNWCNKDTSWSLMEKFFYKLLLLVFLSDVFHWCLWCLKNPNSAWINVFYAFFSLPPSFPRCPSTFCYCEKLLPCYLTYKKS